MIDRFDKAMLALQAAATARKLYGVEHAAATRQVDIATETLSGMLGERAALRLVRPFTIPGGTPGYSCLRERLRCRMPATSRRPRDDWRARPPRGMHPAKRRCRREPAG